MAATEGTLADGSKRVASLIVGSIEKYSTGSRARTASMSLLLSINQGKPEGIPVPFGALIAVLASVGRTVRGRHSFPCSSVSVAKVTIAHLRQLVLENQPRDTITSLVLIACDKGRCHTLMALRPLKSFLPNADDVVNSDSPTLGGILLTHLKSYEGLNTVCQHAGLNRGYFRAMLENRNVGLGSLPKEPEYGARQPEVTKRMMEAWNWLERQGLLIHNDQRPADWFTISSEGEALLRQNARFE